MQINSQTKDYNCYEFNLVRIISYQYIFYFSNIRQTNNNQKYQELMFFGLWISFVLCQVQSSPIAHKILQDYIVESGSLDVSIINLEKNQNTSFSNFSHPPIKTKLSKIYNMTFQTIFQSQPKLVFELQQISITAYPNKLIRQLGIYAPILTKTYAVFQIQYSISMQMRNLRISYFLIVSHSQSQFFVQNQEYVTQKNDEISYGAGSRLVFKKILLEDDNKLLKQIQRYVFFSWISGFALESQKSLCVGITIDTFNSTSYNIIISTNLDSLIKKVEWVVLILQLRMSSNLQLSELNYGWEDSSNTSFKISKTYVQESGLKIMIGVKTLCFCITQRNHTSQSLNDGSTLKSSQQFRYINFTHYIFQGFRCPVKYPYFYQNEGKCLKNCFQNGIFQALDINGEKLCKKCPQFCVFCEDNQKCLKCDEIHHYDLLNSSCVCKQQYSCGDKSTDCQKCFSSLSQISLKTPDGVCIQKYQQLNNGTCQCILGFQLCVDELAIIYYCIPNMCYYYPNDINYNVQSLIKDTLSNKVQITISFSVSCQEMNQIKDWEKIVRLNLYQPLLLSYNYSNSKLTITIEYFESIQDQIVNISLNFAQSGIPILSYAYAKIYNVSLVPQDYLIANVYSPNTYDCSIYTKRICYGIIGLVIFTSLIGIYNSKVIVVEMIDVVQISYLALFTFDYANPMLNSILNLKHLWGVNLFNFLSGSVQSPKSNLLNLSKVLFRNFNIMMVFIMVPVSLGFVLLIASRLKKLLKTKLKSLSTLMFGQYLLFGILVSSYNFFISFVLFCSNSQSINIQFYISITQVVVFVVSLLWVLTMFGIKDFMFFGQFKYLMKTNKLSQFYYYFPLVQRILISFAFAFGGDTYVPIIGVILILITGVFYLAIVRPFAETYQNIRSVFFNLCSISIISLYLFQKIKNIKGQNPYILFPLAIVALLLLVISVSIFLILHKLAKNYLQHLKNVKQEQIALQLLRQQKEAQEQMKEHMRQQLRNPNINPIARKMIAGTLKTRKPHIDYLNPPEAVSDPNQLDPPRPGLSISRIDMVDQMLRLGIV